MAEETKIIMSNLEELVTDKPAKQKYMLEAKKVKVFYNDFEALKGIDMKIKPNKVTAFIGPSGCGKSTFLRLFNRMNDYVDGFRMEGTIKIDGEDIYGKKVQVEQLRKQVGMVFPEA
jgi:phosphate transport system ATP-binding protein